MKRTGLAPLALLLAAGCAPARWNRGLPGADAPPVAIPGVFLTNVPPPAVPHDASRDGERSALKEASMRTVIVPATLAGLVLVAPAAAQSAALTPPARHQVAAAQHLARSSVSRETFVAVMSGAYAVPAVETHATGTAELTLTGSRLQYRVSVDSIRDITGAYLHIGRAGEEAPAVADLFDGVKAGPVSGVLASGTLGARDLHETTLPRLIRALKNDQVYVTVHTLGHPGSELRGQLRIQPVVANR